MISISAQSARRVGFGAGLLATTILSPMPAFAQVQPEPAAERAVVVVTARRREEELQDTPVAVSAFNSDVLERLQITSTEDLDQVTPNLRFTSHGNLTGNNSAAQVFIRGIGQVDATAAVDPGVGIYIDDVYIGRSVGGAMDFRDLSGVQVLRGPQGTLFGRNTIGGAVLLSTNKPSGGHGGVVRGGVGDDNLFEGFMAVDMPLTENLAARVAGGVRKRDGYVTRAYDGMDLGDENSRNIQGTLVWTPHDAVELILRADYADENENGSPFVFQTINENQAFVAAASVGAGCPGATFPPPNVPMIDDDRCANDLQYRGPFENGGTADAYSTLENSGVSLTAQWEVSPEITVTSITSGRRLEWTGARDADNTPLLILHTQYDSESEQFSQEVRAGFEFGRLNGVLGVFYFDEESFDHVGIDLAAPPPAVAAGGPGSRDLQFVNLDTESAALFTEWSFDVTDRLSLSAGVRYSEETKGLQGILLNVNPRTNPDPDPLPATTPPLFLSPERFERDFESTTASASVKYRWSDAIMTYVSFAQGFKSGGFNQRYNAPPPNFEPIGFDEETAETWEIGAKTNFLRGLVFNAAAFSTEYDDIQLTYRLGVVPLLFNAGKATIEGVELEFTYDAIDNLVIDGSVGMLDNSIDEITAVPGTTATVGPNNSLPYTPEYTISLGAGYDFQFGDYTLTPRIDATRTAEYFFDAANSVEVAQTEDITTVNAAVTLANDPGRWKLRLSANNLTDELYPVMGNSSMTTSSGYAEIIYARPKSFTLTFEKEF